MSDRKDLVGWMLVDRHSHRVARAPDGTWGMYCPQRGPDWLIYTPTWASVLHTLSLNTACPHSELIPIGGWRR